MHIFVTLWAQRDDALLSITVCCKATVCILISHRKTLVTRSSLTNPALWRNHWSRNRAKRQYLDFEWYWILYTWATCGIISESRRAYAYLNNMHKVCFNIRISTLFYSKTFSTWHPKLPIFKDSLEYQCTTSRDVATQYSIRMILGTVTIEKL